MHIYSKLTRLLWVSILVITMLLVSLSLVFSEIKEKGMGEKKGLEVTILLFSGRPNPTYLLEDKNVLDQLKELLDKAKTNERFEKTTVITSILGYNGIVVDNPAKIHGLPARIAVHKGNIEVKNESKKFLIDENKAIENLLIEQALEKGVIDEKAVKFIKSD